ncbi:MAG: hypothetical protein FWH34_00905 [Desulfovibrionaceae bacterium]|nr:hypothetical protein [Desulfovibrionaceae bacterium]
MTDSKKHLLIVLFWHLEKDPRVLREVHALREHFTLTVAALSAEGVDGVSWVPLSMHPHPRNLRWVIKQILPKVCVRALYALLGKQAPPEYSATAKMDAPKAAGASLRELGNIALRAAKIALWSFFPQGRVQEGYKLHYTVASRVFSPPQPYDAVLAIDIQTLPLAFQAAKGAPVVLDAHEYFLHEYAEEDGWQKRFHTRNAEIGALLVPRCAAMVTVSEGLAHLFAGDYGIAPHVVYSGPEFQQLDIVVPQPGRIRLVHHGRANPDRKLEGMIEMMQWLDERFSLDLYLAYPGEYGERLRRMAEKTPRARLLPPVPMTEIVRVINTYDVGLYILSPTSKNNAFALPNKFFEFIQARLVIAIGPTPDMARLVQQHDLGIVADDFTPKNLAARLNTLTVEDILRFKRNAAEAAKLYCAEQNMAKLRSILSSVVTHKRNDP